MRTSCTGICMYRQPFVVFASSRVFTLETLRGLVRRVPERKIRYTHYARRCCSSVIAGTFRAVEKGFHRLMKSHTPETESPKLRGELSSI